MLRPMRVKEVCDGWYTARTFVSADTEVQRNPAQGLALTVSKHENVQCTIDMNFMNCEKDINSTFNK